MSTGSRARSQDTATACSLNAADAARQRDVFADLCRRALVHVERDDTGVAFRFRNEEGVRRDLEGYVNVERDCCAFLDFAIEGGDGEAVLRIAAGEGTPAAVLHAMYGPRDGA